MEFDIAEPYIKKNKKWSGHVTGRRLEKNKVSHDWN